jgi:DNA polymerase III alpha subunit
VFVHLHCHSHYSFLRGVASPEEIIAAAIEQNMPAVALTDAAKNRAKKAIEAMQCESC